MIRYIQTCSPFKPFNFIASLLLAISLAANNVYADLPTLSMVEEQVNRLNGDEITDTASIAKLQQIKEDLQALADLQQKNAELQVILEQAPQFAISISAAGFLAKDTFIKIFRWLNR